MASESAQRHAMPRSESIPSKQPTMNDAEHTPGATLLRPTPSAWNLAHRCSANRSNPAAATARLSPAWNG